MLRFTDGQNFDTSGDFRIEQREDGLYVIVQGILIPVDNEQEAIKVIENMRKRKDSK